MAEASALRDNTELQLLLLLLHFLLALQKYLCDFWESLLDGHLSELGLLNLISGELLASSRSTAVVLEASTGWLDHVELESLH